jgi:hypothetical protein
VRYYGWYSNRGRGEREKREQDSAVSLPEVPSQIEIIDVSEYRPKKIPSPKWRECIRKVWEVDPLSCPKCGSEMKIISFINETDSSADKRACETSKSWSILGYGKTRYPLSVPLLI